MRIGRRGMLALAGIWLLSCDALFGIQDGQPLSASGEGGVDASVDTGGDSSGDSGRDGAVESSAADTSGDAPPLCAGPVIYVSPTGSDTYPGCVETAPKKTIGAAIAAASAVASVTTIQVCRGTYNENPLLITTATSLMGGYNCGTWKRTPNYGYPTFDNTNTTVIQNADVSLSGATLTISGNGATSVVVVDGFTILGATSGTTSGTVPALVTSSNAAPTISNNELTGGSLTVPAGNASIGVQVISASTPTITNNRINGGSGIIPVTSHEVGHASDGIFADGSSTSVQILANTINGGSGAAQNTSAGGSVGIELLGVGTAGGPAYTVRGNTIVGGTGTSVGAGATIGVYVGGTANLILDSNSIDGGGGTTGVYCGTGVTSQASGALSVTANRIYGGNCGLASNTAPSYGLLITGPIASTVVYNNMIHSGTSANLTALGSGAIFLNSVASADIRHNTLVAGTLGAGVWLNTGTSGAKVVNNILAGTGSDAGLVISTCAGPPALAAFENNLMFGTTQGLFKSDCTGLSFSSVDAMTAALLANQAGAAVQGNVTLASTCTTDAGTDSGCIVSAGCTTPATCLTTFFGGWDVTSLGYKNLFPTAPFAGACPTKMAPPAGNGWTLAVSPLPPCVVTRSSLNDMGLTGLGVDLYGNCRTSTPSMGADEDSSGSCQ